MDSRAQVAIAATALVGIISILFTAETNRTVSVLAIAITGIASAHLYSMRLNGYRQRLQRVAQLAGGGKAPWGLSAAISELEEKMSELTTDRESRDRELEDLRTVLNTMRDGVLVADRFGKLVRTNPAFDEIAPNSEDRTVMEALRDPALLDAFEKVKDVSHAETELELIGDDPQWFTVTLSRLPESRGVVGVLHDITPLRNAEDLRRDFVANASHELRTPLTAIRGYAETLLDGAVDDKQTAERFLGIVLKHTRRLQRIIDDLISLSRASSPEVRFRREAVDVWQVVADVVDGLESRWVDRELSVDLQRGDLPMACANERALDQVFLNLVDNAIKYTLPGGRIHISATADDENVEFRIFNTTPISEIHLPRLFDRFYRIDRGRDRRRGGFGLGLAIVKEMLETIDGEITVISASEGTTFHVQLPRATEEECAELP